MDALSRHMVGMSIGVRDAYRILGAPGDYNRGRWSQWNAWEKYRFHGGNLAAYPSTSNHGLGLAVDLFSMAVRSIVDRIGAPFGWAKRWSDAPSEWWHLRWRPGVWRAPAGDPVLRMGSKGASVRALQRLLRAKGFKSVPVRGLGHGRFRASTLSAVKRFQRAHGLNPDGVVGKSTWAALRRGH